MVELLKSQDSPNSIDVVLAEVALAAIEDVLEPGEAAAVLSRTPVEPTREVTTRH